MRSAVSRSRPKLPIGAADTFEIIDGELDFSRTTGMKPRAAWVLHECSYRGGAHDRARTTPDPPLPTTFGDESDLLAKTAPYLRIGISHFLASHVQGHRDVVERLTVDPATIGCPPENLEAVTRVEGLCTRVV